MLRLIRFQQEVHMRFRTSLTAFAALTALAALSATGMAADKYSADPSHSSVGFAVKHMVVSKVKGYFNDYTVDIVYDDKDITKSSVEVAIKTASIDTKQTKRDDHLRSPDFFDAAKFPEITFKSKRIEKSGEGYVAVGDLTMRGVTKEITLPFTFAGVVTDPYGNTRLGLSGGTKINRQDYGVSWSKSLDNGGLVVSDDVEIEIEIEAVKAK
jgi:polyisoprenoid-binding protein YceI